MHDAREEPRQRRRGGRHTERRERGERDVRLRAVCAGSGERRRAAGRRVGHRDALAEHVRRALHAVRDGVLQERRRGRPGRAGEVRALVCGRGDGDVLTSQAVLPLEVPPQLTARYDPVAV